MLEKTADDTDDSNPLAHSLDPWTQAADSADDQVYLHSCSRGGVKSFNHFGVHERVHLGDDPAAPTCFGVLLLATHKLEKPLPHVSRCDDEFSVQSLPR